MMNSSNLQKSPRKDSGYHDELAKLYYEINNFNNHYCESLDDGNLDDWPFFFTKNAFYSVTARENFDANLPVGLIYCSGRNMMEDRVFALQNTAMFAPRYLRHFITNTIIKNIDANGTISAGANYILAQTLHDYPESKIHQVGKFVDEFVREDGQLLLKKRICVYDSLLIPNDLVLPV